jgi:hypothetical protein
MRVLHGRPSGGVGCPPSRQYEEDEHDRDKREGHDYANGENAECFHKL